MATRNPVNSALEVDSFSHYLQGFHTSQLVGNGISAIQQWQQASQEKTLPRFRAMARGGDIQITRPRRRSRLRSFRKPGDFVKKIVRSGSSKSIAYSIHMAFWVVEILGESTHGLLKNSSPFQGFGAAVCVFGRIQFCFWNKNQIQ